MGCEPINLTANSDDNHGVS